MVFGELLSSYLKFVFGLVFGFIFILLKTVCLSGLRVGMNTVFGLVFGEILARCLKVVLLGIWRVYK